MKGKETVKTIGTTTAGRRSRLIAEAAGRVYEERNPARKQIADRWRKMSPLERARLMVAVENAADAAGLSPARRARLIAKAAAGVAGKGKA